jgi:hypothetical protein
MSETGERVNQPQELTAERIRLKTGFNLAIVYPDFNVTGYVSPSVHEDRELFSAQRGEERVLTSLYIDDEGAIQLGMFVLK